MSMLLGCIADDFTGASDLANTLAKEGMATTQYVGVPRADADPSCEAGVVSLKSRSIAPGEAVKQSLAALEWLERQGCQQFLFKYCSTFDSTPEGNIGPVAEALLDRLGASVAVICPVFPATGRTLFMGHMFVKDRLLSESGMQNHPLTPMTDPDIARWLRRQTVGEVGLVPYATVAKGAAAIQTALDAHGAEGRRLVVVDAVFDDDLRQIGTAIASHRLVTGGSGIALGLPANFRAKGLLSGKGSAFSGTTGPAVVLSGSCSVQSQAQVAHYARSHPVLQVEPDSLMEGRISVGQAADFVRQHLADVPMVYSSADPARVKAAQGKYGTEIIATRIEAFFGDLSRLLAETGVTRIVVGGGETSGAVVGALGVSAFAIGPEIDPGVPALAAEGRYRVNLALKSGNFGALDFYDKAVAALG